MVFGLGVLGFGFLGFRVNGFGCRVLEFRVACVIFGVGRLRFWGVESLGCLAKRTGAARVQCRV